MADSLWASLWNATHRALIGQLLRPGTVGATVNLPSGGGMTLDEYKAFLMGLIAKFQPRGEETYCNIAVAIAARKFGYYGLNSMTANQQVSVLRSLPQVWKIVSAQDAADHALRTGLVVAAKRYAEHGHVAVVFPAACEKSLSWGELVPVLANVGKTNGVLRASKAFPVAEGAPEYFAYDPKADGPSRASDS